MNVMRWVPWKYFLRKTALANGFLDPLSLLAKIRRFAQPSEVNEPVELLRAGAYFHARGLINARVIQQNLDWIWPYWVEEQFDPESVSFLPRAFSLTHVNLTHRNWTAVGIPGWDGYPIVDPRGLVTPYWDGWSVDTWVFPDGSDPLIPCRMKDIDQRLEMKGGCMAVRTRAKQGGVSLQSRVFATPEKGKPVCRIEYMVDSSQDGWFAVSLRSYNPEGISFINEIELDPDRQTVKISGEEVLHTSAIPDRHSFSKYQDGDVFRKLPHGEEVSKIKCPIGMITAALLYRYSGGSSFSLTLNIPLEKDKTLRPAGKGKKLLLSWPEALNNHAELHCPDPHFEYLYEGAVRTLILLSPDWAYPGPFTYKRFWYRDAVFMVYALLGAGLLRPARQILDHFPEHQNIRGYFHSQEGEWDTNGQVLWAYQQYSRLTGERPEKSWMDAVSKGAEWIIRKRMKDKPDALHAGLFPAGFSAEHLGNIDHYYWDNFWGIAGLQAAATLHDRWGDADDARRFRDEAGQFLHAVDRSLEKSRPIRNYQGIPASPYRRMDAGAVGSISAGYPLHILPATDPRLLGTVEYLMNECFVQGAFFQEMIHSGMNAYLTLQVAQVLLDAGDERYMDLINRVAELASPTGQWPEAIHPATNGGCMGDGHHAWASAEWILMIRSLFVCEEAGVLTLGRGIPDQWLKSAGTIAFGPTPTSFGPVTVRVVPDEEHPVVQWDARWRQSPDTLRIKYPGAETQVISAPPPSGQVELYLGKDIHALK